MKLSGLQRAAQLGKCSLSGPNEAVIISRVTQMQSSEAANSRLGREKQKSKVFPGLGVTDVGSEVEAKRGLGAGSPNRPPPSPGLQLPVSISSQETDLCRSGSSVPGSNFHPSQQRVNHVIQNDTSSASEAAKKPPPSAEGSPCACAKRW